MYENQTSIAKIVGYSVLGIFALIGLFSSFTIVEPQEVGVVVRAGSLSRVLSEGFHFKFPFIEDVTKMDLQTKAYPVTELAYSKDAQTVSGEVTLNYSLTSSSVEQVFREVRNDYEARLVSPAVKEAIKVVFSNYTAQGLLDNRAKIPLEIKTILTERLVVKGFNLDAVSITNLDFDDAYEAAVREKQVQEQNALAQVNITRQEEEKKEQEILKAQALAEKTRLESVALQSAQGKAVIEKIYAEAALEAAKKWNGNLPQTMIPGGALPFLNLDVR